jgi:hypothetical protein
MAKLAPARVSHVRGQIPSEIAVGGPVLLLTELIVVGRGGEQDHAKGSRLTSFACASVKSHSQNPFEYHANQRNEEV